MNTKYLLQDYYGTFSKIKYGSQGDQVIICGRSDRLLKVVNKENKQLFYINENLLSDVPVQRNTMQSMHKSSIISKSKKR